MTRIDALQELLAKVEAGDRGTGLNTISVFPEPKQAMYCADAFYGSLDAAKALHEAVLPGSDWFVHMHTAAPSVGRWHVTLRPHQNNHPRMREVGPIIGEPARAWLIAILSALIAQERDQ